MGRSVGPKHDGPSGRSAYMGENTGRGLAKSVGRFSSRDLPRSFGFPISRNQVPMGVGRSNLDQKMHNFKGFDFVHSKHFCVNDSANQNRAGRLLNANRPSRRSRISGFSCRRATQGRYRRSWSVSRLGDSVRRRGRSRTLTTVVNSDCHPLMPHYIFARGSRQFTLFTRHTSDR